MSVHSAKTNELGATRAPLKHRLFFNASFTPIPGGNFSNAIDFFLRKNQVMAIFHFQLFPTFAHNVPQCCAL